MVEAAVETGEGDGGDDELGRHTWRLDQPSSACRVGSAGRLERASERAAGSRQQVARAQRATGAVRRRRGAVWAQLDTQRAWQPCRHAGSTQHPRAAWRLCQSAAAPQSGAVASVARVSIPARRQTKTPAAAAVLRVPHRAGAERRHLSVASPRPRTLLLPAAAVSRPRLGSCPHACDRRRRSPARQHRHLPAPLPALVPPRHVSTRRARAQFAHGGLIVLSARRKKCGPRGTASPTRGLSIGPQDDARPQQIPEARKSVLVR